MTYTDMMHSFIPLQADNIHRQERAVRWTWAQILEGTRIDRDCYDHLSLVMRVTYKQPWRLN